MAGIEKIKDTIIDTANSRAKEIIDAAKLEAKNISLEAQKQAEKQEEEILSKSMQKAEAVQQAGESSCALLRKNKILEAKMQLINECFEKSVDKLKNLDDATYFSVIKNLVIDSAVKGTGELYLNKNDFSRIPSDFQNSISKDLKDGKEIVIAKNYDDKIKSGCVLKYNEIEINCGFEAIINSEKERLIDSVNNALFK